MTLSNARVLHGGKCLVTMFMSGCVPGKLTDNNTSQHLITAWCMQGTVVGTEKSRPTNPGGGVPLSLQTLGILRAIVYGMLGVYRC